MGYNLIPAKTYTGYNSNGEEICTVQAFDVNQIINSVEIEKKVEIIKEQISIYIDEYNKKLEQLKDFTYMAIIIKDYNFEEPIERLEIKNQSIKEAINNSLNGLVENSYESQNELQNEYNNEAYNNALNTSGVVNVNEV